MDKELIKLRIDEIIKHIDFIDEDLKKVTIENFNVNSLLSRGTKELTPYLIDVYKQGGTLGAFKNVYKTYEKNGMLKPSDEISLNKFNVKNELPWNFIRYVESKNKALTGYVYIT